MSVSSKMKEVLLPPIVVDPEAPITIPAQVVEQIKLLIVLGKLQPNQALPPLARLAEHLRIGYSTVISVYNELIATGYLVGHRGKGTFVADSAQVRQLANRKHFYDMLGEVFNAASQFGITAAEFSGAAYAQAALKQRHQLNLVFVNFLPDTIDVIQSLQTDTGLSVQSIDWTKLQSKEPQALKELAGADFVITSTKHLWDVADWIADSNKEVIGIDVQPDMQLLSYISALPRNSKVLFVCRDQSGSQTMQHLSTCNINNIEPTAVTLDWVQQNTQKMQNFDLVVCSPKIKSQLAKYVLHQKLMVFGIRIDPLNLLVIQARLAAASMEKSL
ncbi:MAG: GntR family transcriptional regulator [Microcoleus sp. PH2017_25_DOB_D_A]|uniref:GntR family transcriptional regulator n=1 Tax=unclassified Microcoleus TaxID=2642155 RepID=UPI001D625489|nr:MULTISPECIES: winged helix-turn-helix domain-containing protein [unclassified Microcoleus]MCC3499647.1 GntR family transcriptional regulator [Microcoleus sp. PH2017_15_JOR_U_A]MCC3512258.1 GntR family transcriptional regulator [Microcoleus sp. PH2017_17_BER_D_A]MCC3537586.1 GntR family transcriptional regulator [Microcoleus sp. PH2017_25_DOB_D_A]MCC3549829.1 GntR family transcriptional regulator [Microcoleus sp. PH2017_24_DOB_U_A]